MTAGEPSEPEQATYDRALRDYLDEAISLGKAAERLGLSRFNLMARFERLSVPLRIGPASLDEARDEIRTARVSRES